MDQKTEIDEKRVIEVQFRAYQFVSLGWDECEGLTVQQVYDKAVEQLDSTEWDAETDKLEPEDIEVWKDERLEENDTESWQELWERGSTNLDRS